MFKKLISDVTFKSISFSKLFLCCYFDFPLPDPEKLNFPLKKSSPASENFPFPPTSENSKIGKLGGKDTMWFECEIPYLPPMDISSSADSLLLFLQT